MLEVFRRKRTQDESLSKPQLAELRDALGDYRLPTFPRVAMAVLRHLRDPDIGLDRIADEIALDPNLHVRVLRTINAAAFGLSQKVDDLQHALALLGRAKLEALVVAVAVKKALPQRPIPGFDANSFWLSASRRASLARYACSCIAPREAAEALTVGLLQDLAVPVLARTRSKDYVKIYNQWRHEPSTELAEMEKEAFGFDHAQVGNLIAREWDLSENMATLILEHHNASSGQGIAHAIGLTARLRDLPADHVDTEGLVQRASDFLSVPLERAETIVESSFLDARDFLKALE